MFRGSEDFDVMQAVTWFAEEGALDVAEDFFAGFSAVGVDGLSPALDKPGEEVGVGRSCGTGEAFLDQLQGFGCSQALKPVQRGGNDGAGVGGHHGCGERHLPRTRTRTRTGCRGEGGGEVWPRRLEGFTGEAGAWQDLVREGEAAAGFTQGDAEPKAEELSRVPAPVIGRRGDDPPGSECALPRSAVLVIGVPRSAVLGRAGSRGGWYGPAGVGFVQGFDAVVPTGDPRTGAAGTRSCGVSDGGCARAVHGTGGKQLNVLNSPGKVLNLTSKLGNLHVVGPSQGACAVCRGGIEQVGESG